MGGPRYREGLGNRDSSGRGMPHTRTLGPLDPSRRTHNAPSTGQKRAWRLSRVARNVRKMSPNDHAARQVGSSFMDVDVWGFDATTLGVSTLERQYLEKCGS